MEEIWLRNKIAEYNESPIEALENMLLHTSDLIEQYMKNKDTSTERSVIQCIELNKIFIERISHNKR